MRYRPEHKAEIHQKIVKDASRHIRAEGITGTAVSAVMRRRPDLAPFRSAGALVASVPDWPQSAKEIRRYSLPGIMPGQVEASFSPRMQREARESATAKGDSHLT